MARPSPCSQRPRPRHVPGRAPCRRRRGGRSGRGRARGDPVEAPVPVLRGLAEPAGLEDARARKRVRAADGHAPRPRRELWHERARLCTRRSGDRPGRRGGHTGVHVDLHRQRGGRGRRGSGRRRGRRLADDRPRRSGAEALPTHESNRRRAHARRARAHRRAERARASARATPAGGRRAGGGRQLPRATARKHRRRRRLQLPDQQDHDRRRRRDGHDERRRRSSARGDVPRLGGASAHGRRGRRVAPGAEPAHVGAPRRRPARPARPPRRSRRRSPGTQAQAQ